MVSVLAVGPIGYGKNVGINSILVMIFVVVFFIFLFSAVLPVLIISFIDALQIGCCGELRARNNDGICLCPCSPHKRLYGVLIYLQMNILVPIFFVGVGFSFLMYIQAQYIIVIGGPAVVYGVLAIVAAVFVIAVTVGESEVGGDKSHANVRCGGFLLVVGKWIVSFQAFLHLTSLKLSRRHLG